MQLVQTAQQKFPTLFSNTDYPAILLAKLQHYGIYTRMLDLTENALVALYFACKGNADKDGEVLVFSADPVSIYNPMVNAIADTYRLTFNTSPYDFSVLYYKILHQPYYSSRLYPPEFAENDSKVFLDSMQNPFFVEAGNICERQKNQSGYFIIFPNQIDTKNNKMTDELLKLPKDNKSIVKRIIIPKKIKTEIIDLLARFGITPQFLFADSVDEVCKSIIDDYRKCFPY